MPTNGSANLLMNALCALMATITSTFRHGPTCSICICNNRRREGHHRALALPIHITHQAAPWNQPAPPHADCAHSRSAPRRCVGDGRRSDGPASTFNGSLEFFPALEADGKRVLAQLDTAQLVARAAEIDFTRAVPKPVRPDAALLFRELLALGRSRQSTSELSPSGCRAAGLATLDIQKLPN